MKTKPDKKSNAALRTPADADRAARMRERPRRVRRRLQRRDASSMKEKGTSMEVVRQPTSPPPTSEGRVPRSSLERSRLPKKAPKADWRRGYGFRLEISFVGALLVAIVFFRMPLRADWDYEIPIVEQETVTMEEIQQTKQVIKPPPPPRPPVPVEVPNDIIIEGEELNLDAAYDVGEAVAELPPPPPLPALPEPEEVDVEEEEIFVVVEEMPELIGGIAVLQSRIKYPEMARQAGVNGRVFVQFVVNEQGNVIEPVVLRGIGGGCDEEAMRVIKTAKFKPGRQRGRPVRVRMVIPVRFELKGV